MLKCEVLSQVSFLKINAIAINDIYDIERVKWRNTSLLNPQPTSTLGYQTKIKT